MQRSSVFAALKPTCVATSQAALDVAAGNAPAALLLARLADLSELLSSLRVDGQAAQVDAKLAEYVFFPLSHVLRQRQTLPVAVLESTLRCLLTLLDTGWRNQLPAELGIQLVILLTFFAASSNPHGGPSSKTSEDLRVLAFTCLSSVFHSMTASSTIRSSLTALANIPALGHAITTILDGIKDDGTIAVNLEALGVLTVFVNRIGDREVLSSFLPGVLSCLAQILTPSTKLRRSYKLLAGCFDLITKLLGAVVSDRFSFPAKEDGANAPSSSESDELVPRLDSSWLSANAAQTKLALANVVRQRKHDRLEVRDALQRLCLLVVRDCAANLSESVAMMLDTLIVLAQQGGSDSLQSELQVVIASNGVILDSLRSGLYDRFLSLPRNILSNDSVEKQRVAGHIRTSMSLLSESDAELSIISTTLLTTLRSSLLSVVSASSAAPVRGSAIQETVSPADLTLSGPLERSTTFPLVFAGSKGDSDNANMLLAIIESVSSSSIALHFARQAIDLITDDETENRLANYWLATNLLRTRYESLRGADDMLTVDLATEEELELRDELYALSVSILDESLSDDTVDWRVKAMALESVSLQAAATGDEFRPELADVLFQVLHILGSGNPQLREHAIICVNNLARSCRYQDVQEMIIKNNDYLVNGVSARLNAFDLSPEIPQVLLMLIKLTGPALLPYLDDITDNIFEALENFHGYPLLVEMLFSVLRGMVTEGVKSPALAITDSNTTRTFSSEVQEHRPSTFAGLMESLRLIAAKKRNEEDAEALDSGFPESLPKQPWKELRTFNDPSSTIEEEDIQSDDEEPQPPEEPPVPLSATYKLLQRITTLTQHHLPSSSAPLRASLLSLLATSIPYLGAHEDSILPLIHLLWPVLVARLNDKEAFVVAGVLDAMAAMAAAAGAFVRGRITDIWPRIQRIARDVGFDRNASSAPIAATISPATTKPVVRVTADEVSDIVRRPAGAGTTTAGLAPTAATSSGLTAVSTTRRAATTTYTPATTTQVRNGLERFLLALAAHVELPHALFADIAGSMLWHALVGGRTDVREALSVANRDAVWLVVERARTALPAA